MQADAPVIPSTTALIISALLQVAGETWAPARRAGTGERGNGKCEAAIHGTGQCTHIPPCPLFRAANVGDQQHRGTRWGREVAFPRKGLPNSCPPPGRRKVTPRGMTCGVIAEHGHGCGCDRRSCFPLHATPCRGGHPWDSLAGSPLPTPHLRFRKAPNIGITALSTHPRGAKHSAPYPAPIPGLWPEGPRPSRFPGSRGPQVSAHAWPPPPAAMTPCLHQEGSIPIGVIYGTKPEMLTGITDFSLFPCTVLCPRPTQSSTPHGW